MIIQLLLVPALIAVLFPDTLQALADMVGVTRGVDLLLYGLAVVIIYLVGSTSARFREQEARLVLLARQVAITEAASRYPGGELAAPPVGQEVEPQSIRRTSHQ